VVIEPKPPEGLTDEPTQRAVQWLLKSAEPAIRLLARRDLLGEDIQPEESVEALSGHMVRALLSSQKGDGGFGVHPYRKWTGAHWRLISLVELGIPSMEPRAVAAANTVLQWLAGDVHRRAVRTIDGLARRCASQEGNALAVACRLGLADDRRVQLLAQSLIEWQWADGGWNCDINASGRRSSFHESLPPMWGLHEFGIATGDDDATEAAGRTAELLLKHRLFKTLATGDVVHKSWVVLHYPPYWHYDILQALVILGRMNLADDPRTHDACEILISRRLRDGRWRLGAYWWHSRSASHRTVEVVDWGRSGPNEMITLNALRALKAAGRL
jgi:hypothetical protein